MVNTRQNTNLTGIDLFNLDNPNHINRLARNNNITSNNNNNHSTTSTNNSIINQLQELRNLLQEESSNSINQFLDRNSIISYRTTIINRSISETSENNNRNLNSTTVIRNNNNSIYQEQLNNMSTNDTSPLEQLKLLKNIPIELIKLDIKNDLDKIEQTIEIWEEEVKQFELSEPIKRILLVKAIRETPLNYLIKKELDTYEKLKSKLISETGDEDFKIIYSPSKKQPLKCFQTIKRIMKDKSLYQKILNLRKHLDENIINSLTFLDSEEEVEKRLKQIESMIEEDRDNLAKNNLMNNINNNITNQREDLQQIINKAIRDQLNQQQQLQNQQITNSQLIKQQLETPLTAEQIKIKELEEKINELSINKIYNQQQQQNIHQVCNFHAKYHLRARKCTGENCKMFKPTLFTNFDTIRKIYSIAEKRKPIEQNNQKYQNYQPNSYQQNMNQQQYRQNYQQLQPNQYNNQNQIQQNDQMQLVQSNNQQTQIQQPTTFNETIDQLIALRIQEMLKSKNI